MGLIAPLAALLGLEVDNIVARTRAAIIVYGLIAALLSSGLIFLVVAGFLALADMFGAIPASLIMSGTFFVLALAIYLGALISKNRHKRQVAERRRSSETGTLLTTAAFTALPMIMRSPAIVRLGLPAAAIAAFALLRDRSDKD